MRTVASIRFGSISRRIARRSPFGRVPALASLAINGAAAGSLGSGQGLTGMKERAGIYGGTVEAGRTVSGGWRVRAVLTLNGNKGEE